MTCFDATVIYTLRFDRFDDANHALRYPDLPDHPIPPAISRHDQRQVESGVPVLEREEHSPSLEEIGKMRHGEGI